MDKIIKYLDKSEETINKLINLKRELKEESPETQRYIFMTTNKIKGFLLMVIHHIHQ